MGVVVSFIGFTPAARFDSVPWADVEVEEAPASTGPWTLIDTLSLSPVDPDPSEPGSRDLTTTNGTAENLWYRLTFVDGGAGTSEPTAPIQNVVPVEAAYATKEQLAAKLSLTGNRAIASASDLQRVLNAAAVEINREIGGPLDSPNAEELDLLATVNLGRAQDLWTIEGLPVGVIGLGGETPLLTPRDSWARHANTLAALKREWGLA